MKRALSIAITVVVLALFARFAVKFPWHSMWLVLIGARPAWIVVAIVANIASISLKGQGWALLMGEPARGKWKLAQEATFIGAATGSFAVSIGGEAARVRWIVMRSAVTTGGAVRGIVRSRITEIIMFATVIVLGTPLLPGTSWFHATLIAALILLAAAALLWRAGRSQLPPTWKENRAGRVLIEAFEVLHAPGVRGALAFGLLNWGAQWLAFGASVLAVAPHTSFGYPLAAMILVNQGGALKLTPGNVGILTASYVMAAPSFGITAPAAVAASVVLQAIEIIPVVLLGGWIVLADRARGAPADVSPMDPIDGI